MRRFTLRQLLPAGPVLSASARATGWPGDRPSGAHYIGSPRVTHPVLPLLPFGVAYDLDLVVVTTHPHWDMHELARLQTPEGPLWIAKDARASTLEQAITAEIEAIDHWMPELPVPRHEGPVQVTDRSTEESLDLDIAWQTPDGEHAELTYRGPPPTSPQRKRNGSTMGHSRATLLAALDLSHRNWARHCQVRYDGAAGRIHRLFYLKPFAMALRQVQGGFVTGDFHQEATDDGLVLTHRRGPHTLSQPWHVTPKDGGIVLSQTDPVRTISARFGDHDSRLELCEITVTQWGRADPPMRARFCPALPDLRAPFSGEITSHWVLDINGQSSHAVGRLVARWTEAGVELRLIGERPWWVADRPMRSQIGFDDDTERTRVIIERT